MAASIAEPKRKRKINSKRVKELAMKGTSCLTISRDQGVHCSTITRYLASIGLDNTQLSLYKQKRPDIKALIGMKGEDVILRTLDTYNQDTIEAMPHAGKNGLLMACNAIVGTRHQEERLERDLSTSNLASIHSDVAALKALQSGGKPDDPER
jgi:hypothetical protein